MQYPTQTRRDFALFWATFWPSAGTTFGATLGGVIGVCSGGILPGLLFAVLGGVVGLELGEFLGAFVQGLCLPWIVLFGEGNWRPMAGGISGAALLAAVAVQLKAGPASTVFLSLCGFVCGAWLAILVRLAADSTGRRQQA